MVRKIEEKLRRIRRVLFPRGPGETAIRCKSVFAAGRFHPQVRAFRFYPLAKKIKEGLTLKSFQNL
jgi:hypothetical protein